MSIKLLNVARGSLAELLEDYTDYIRVRGLRRWEVGSKEVVTMRRIGVEHTDSEYFVGLAKTRNDEVVANMTIVLIHQAETLLMRYIKHVEDRFKAEGGVKERMYKIRVSSRS